MFTSIQRRTSALTAARHSDKTLGLTVIRRVGEWLAHARPHPFLGALLLVGIAGCSRDLGQTVGPTTRSADVLNSAEAATVDGPVLVADAFSRIVDRGWGSANLGGVWSFSTKDLSLFEVTGDRGLIKASTISPLRAMLKEAQVLDGSGLVAMSFDVAPDIRSSGHKVEVYARRRETAGTADATEFYYRFRVRAFGDGEMDVRVEKRVAGLNSWLTENIEIPVVWQVGARYWFRFEYFGTSPATTLRMRVWRDGDPEPTDWQASAVIDEPGLDLPGSVGFRINPPPNQVTYPVTYSFDDLRIVAVGTPNTAPVADPGGPYAGNVGEAVQFDGSGSADADGADDLPLTYEWTFGDGSTSNEVSPSHTYTVAGTFVVTLKVTDARGKSSELATTSATIVGHDPAVLVLDRFDRTSTNGWGSAEIGGPWRIDDAVRPAFRTNGSQAQVVAPDANPLNAIATDGYGMNVTGKSSFSIDVAATGASRFHTVQVYARRDDRVGDGNNYYRYRLRVFGDGKMDLRLEKRVAAVSAFVGDLKPITTVFSPGARYWIRWEAIGVSPATVLRVRVWADGTPEPAAWDLEATVDEPGLDRIGTTGFRVQIPGSGQLTLPVTFTFDDLEYRLAP